MTKLAFGIHCMHARSKIHNPAHICTQFVTAVQFPLMIFFLFFFFIFLFVTHRAYTCCFLEGAMKFLQQLRLQQVKKCSQFKHRIIDVAIIKLEKLVKRNFFLNMNITNCSRPVWNVICVYMYTVCHFTSILLLFLLSVDRIPSQRLNNASHLMHTICHAVQIQFLLMIFSLLLFHFGVDQNKLHLFSLQ